MDDKKIKVCVAGATGWAGSALSKAIIKSPDLEIVSAVSRKYANKNLSEILNENHPSIPIFATADEALDRACDVFVEYTKPEIAKHNIFSALNKNVNVVVGTSGLTDEDYREIGLMAEKKNKAVLAVANFALTVVVMNKLAEMAAKYLPNWEIIEYAHPDKPDAPSGTARELAFRLGQIHQPQPEVPIEKVAGMKESRGARLNSTQVHSVRLPGYLISVEAIFGLKDERLTIRHDAGSGAEPYVQGALLAIRNVNSFTSLKRGLDKVMNF
jgi:4-hydroxy-tetrahydrodipicolinate reductase